MLLCLLRHAHAGDPSKWMGPDDRRPLSARGRGQAERLGAFLSASGFVPDVVLTSPLLRALETAEIVGSALGVGGRVRVEPALGGGLSLERVETLLAGVGSPACVVLVGHDPDFTELLGELVTGAGADGLVMRKGSFACVEVERPIRAGGGLLRWLVAPDLLEPRG